MNLDARKQEIKLTALHLAVDDTIMAECPFCCAQHEHKLAITRKDTGLIYHCFRASCGASGFIPSNSSDVEAPKKGKKTKIRMYDGPVWWPIDYPFSFLQERFGIHPRYLQELGIVDIDELNYLLPVYSIKSNKVSRQLRYFDGTEPKAVLYPYSQGPYYQEHRGKSKEYMGKPVTVVVEDYFSMLKVQQNSRGNVRAVSIVGTHISEEMAIWLGRTSSKIVMMLDPDAVSKAFKWKRTYSLIWPECNVVLLEEDPKDTDNEVLTELLSYV